MKTSKDACEKSALVTSDWLVRCEDGNDQVNGEATQQPRANVHSSKDQIMKRIFQYLKKQEFALGVALVWMVVWSGFAMTEAFNHLA